jgi:hypothetical protein
MTRVHEDLEPTDLPLTPSEKLQRIVPRDEAATAPDMFHREGVPA